MDDKNIEKKISLNVLFIYMMVAFFCAAMVFYVYRMRSKIEANKKEMDRYNQELSLSNKLVDAINESQIQLNLYISSRETDHLNRFNRSIPRIDFIVNSLNNLYGKTQPNDTIVQVMALIRQKKEVVLTLKDLFSYKDPNVLIKKALKKYNKEKREPLLTPQNDTIIELKGKRNFWKRLGDLFSNKQNYDKIIFVSKADTAGINRLSAVKILMSSIHRYAQKSTNDYLMKIMSIENTVSQLILSDQQISSKISSLLIAYYSKTVKLRMDEIRENERVVNQNNLFAIFGGIIALLLILIFVMMIIGDVNKGYQMRKFLEEANKKIKQIMESRHRMLLAVSHDIKTPLNSILGYLRLNKGGKILSREELASMENSGLFILSLLNNLLEFSRLEQGKLEIDKDFFRLRKLCEEIDEMFRPLAKEKGLSLEISFDMDERLNICSDRLKVKQIIINVLSNSIKYTARGSISFHAGYDGKWMNFEWSDTGVGIPREYLDKVFQAFERVEKNNTMAGGTGLGLYVVKGLVDLLEGKMQISSEEGKGTTVKICIPAEGKIAYPTEERSKRLLLVDDDPVYLDVLEKMLIQLGHVVVKCNSMQKLESLQSNISRYDYILTDMDMGNFSGKDVLMHIRQKDKNTPVIVISGREDYSNERAEAAGFFKFLKKPVSLDALRECMGGSSQDSKPFHLQTLEEILGDDKEALKEILTAFVGSTEENLVKMEACIETEDFAGAQFLCHKMLPMFMQVGACEVLTGHMKEMDRSRGDSVGLHPEWKEDMNFMISASSRLVESIKESMLAGL